MKTGQNIIILKKKDTGELYTFGSVAAIYTVFSSEKLKITYPSLRNAISRYAKESPDEDAQQDIIAKVIYDKKDSPFTLYRSALVLAEKTVK